jgi:hypothetical protein
MMTLANGWFTAAWSVQKPSDAPPATLALLRMSSKVSSISSF